MTVELPFMGKIPGGMSLGKVIKIYGTISDEAIRFQVELYAEEDMESDLLMHLNPRFLEETIVRNNRQDEYWGDEEHEGDLPVGAGDNFQLAITCEEEHYKMVFNGSYALFFQHRQPFERAKYLGISGDVNVAMISYEQEEGGLFNPPYGIPLPGGLFFGKRITFKGVIPDDASRFAMDFVCGDSPYPNSDIIFHLNPRFVRGCVVRNHMVDSTWVKEEKDGDMPLAPGQSFCIMVTVHESCYKVKINDEDFCSFNHRMDYQLASHISISGDVVPTLLRFEGEAE